MRYTRGFTLVEVLVVIAIIVVLFALVIPALGRAKAQALNLHCSNRLAGIGKAMSMYADGTGGTLPRLQRDEDPQVPDSGPGYIEWYHAYKWSNRNGPYWCQLGCLYKAGYIDNGVTFYCPAVETWREVYRSNCSADGVWGEGRVDPCLFAQYIYWPQSKVNYTAEQLEASRPGATGNYVAGLPMSATLLVDLNQHKAMVADYHFHSLKTSTWNLNVLFPDGHVTSNLQPRDEDDLGLWHAQDQWYSGAITYTSQGMLWSDSAEQGRHRTESVPVSRYMCALQP
jgi:prepilin-type N-terminal cleavage/methylation domain-containing protein/prepilin-type processing-associated H-X9-DG protein